MHKKYFRLTLAAFRAARSHYEGVHWTASGPNSYGDHLLYERLYDNVTEEIDSLAERLIGCFGESSFDPVKCSQRSKKFIRKWNQIDNPVLRSIQVEKTLLRCLKKTEVSLKRSKKYSLGLEDFIPALASQRETHLYLLKQRYGQ